MDVDYNRVLEIVGDSKRFIKDPSAYYLNSAKHGENLYQVIDQKIIDLYFDKLAYAVDHADELIKGAFAKEFYNFYGMNKNVVKDPIGIVSQLYFDSFVLHVDNDQIGACISNDKLMFGHFIDATWNFDWKLVSSWIN